MAENLTIEERVTALENAAKYKLRYSGEQIDGFSIRCPQEDSSTGGRVSPSRKAQRSRASALR